MATHYPTDREEFQNEISRLEKENQRLLAEVERLRMQIAEIQAEQDYARDLARGAQ